MIVEEESVFFLKDGSTVFGNLINSDVFVTPLFVSKQEDNWNLYSKFHGCPVYLYISKSEKHVIEIMEDIEKKIVLTEEINNILNRLTTSNQIMEKFKHEKIIRIIHGKKNYSLKNNKEYIEEAVKNLRLNEYFVCIKNHAQEPFIFKNHCFIYSRIIIPRVNNVTRIEIQSTLDINPGSAALNWANPEIGRDIESERIDFYNRISPDPLAVLFPRLGSVLLCDISHLSNTDWFKPVMKQIIDYGKFTCYPNKDIIITLGADPEFEFLVHRRDGKGFRVNHAPLEFNGPSRLKGKIGADGHANQIEIRTEPKCSAEEVVEETKQLFTRMRKGMIGVAGNTESIGAHIHFGIRKDGIQGELGIDNNFIQLLDIFLGAHFYDLSGKARGQEYRALSGYRQQPHGFEYRSLPSCIFQNPEITKIVFKIAQGLAQRYYSEKCFKLDTQKASIEQLKEYTDLTDDEINYYFNFINRYKAEDEDIIKNWIEDESKPKIEILFYDEKDFSKQFIADESQIIGDTVVPFDIKICFYPIKVGVNNVAGLTGIGHYVNHTNIQACENGIAFGFGKNFRGNENINYISELIKLKLSTLFDLDSVPDYPNTLNLFREECEPVQLNNFQGLDIEDARRHPNPLTMRQNVNARIDRQYRENDNIEREEEVRDDEEI